MDINAILHKYFQHMRNTLVAKGSIIGWQYLCFLRYQLKIFCKRSGPTLFKVLSKLAIYS